MLWYFANIPLVSNYLHDIELKTYDLLFITRHNLNLDPPRPKNIIIVGIDAGSINKVGVPWPWPRQFHASLVEALTQAKAKLIIFDIIFDTISPLSAQIQDISGTESVAETSFDAGKEDDGFFAQSIKSAMNIILACEAEPLSKSTYQAVLPINTYLKALNNDIGFLGNSSVTYDSDNFVRRAKLIYPEFYKDPAVAGSIAFRAAQEYLNIRVKILNDDSIEFGKRKIPKDFLINFYGPSETITTIPYWKTLELISQGKTSIFKNRIILIGRTKLKASIDPFKSVRSPDAFPTPYAALTPNFSGVELQATILNNLIDNTFIVKANKFVVCLIFLIIGLVASLFISKFRQRLVLCFYTCLLLSAAYIGISFLFFLFFRVSVPTTYPAYGVIFPIYFINLLDQYFIVDKARRRQAKIFRQLVPSQVADEIERMDQDQLALGGSKREITVLFTDIKNFTGLCERNTPETIINILNEFFTEMVKVIHKHNGLVDKFIGDAIMALWGSPKVLEKKIQANLATTCALSMMRELRELNQMWERTGLNETLNIRVGINTDYAVTGNIGSVQRMQFSAVGDGVNVASRLEAVNKVYGTSILLSGNTAKLLDKTQTLREIDTVIVPGKDAPLDIYELLDPKDFIPELIKSYSLALNYYRNKNFEEAINLWQTCTKLDKKDKASRVMLERAVKFRHQELNSKLSENWEPVWTVENK
ncbi:MAG: hypothetical protein A3I68_06845 [Candidatus Melainabacteria bacterium RIFCSPLOWO2_02_FULL_35_15]|nr:MAG: hypothetical protein A3I68_06845 [Candidatus Melainabacteria bacterium RIFCSPLOWO2_02_FULL_35_15]